MINYYILVRQIEQGDIWINNYKVPHAFEWQYSSGIHIEMTGDDAKMYYQHKSANKSDYIAGIHSFPVVSNKFKDLLIDLETNTLEFYPVDLICSTSGDIDNSYYFMNILNNLECFDWDKSQYEELPVSKAPTDVTKLVVRSETLKERNIVRMAEIPSLIIMSDKFRQLVESANLSGIGFQNLADYNEYEI